jgi:hypothetical protein
MITRAQISFVASGERFRPSTLNVPYSETEEPGAIGTRGRYRGIPLPEGSASFDVPETAKDGIRYLHGLVFPLMPALRAAGATDFFIHITYHFDDQCALGFDSDELKLLAEFGCQVSIDCWKADRDETTLA